MSNQYNNSRPPTSPGGLLQMIRTFQLALKLFFDSRVPAITKLVPLAALIYIIFPFDFLPDVLPFLGQLDDLSVLLLGVWAFLRLVPYDVVRQYQGQPSSVDGEYRVVDDEPQGSSHYRG